MVASKQDLDHNYDNRTRSADTGILDVALFAALGEVDTVKTDSANDFFKKKGQPSKYAGLPVTIETLEPIFRKHGIMIIQGSVQDRNDSYGDNVERVTALNLTHELRHVESGQFRIYTLTLPLSAQNPQQLGSAITYGRRYLYQLVAGVIVEDDDANTAVFGTKSKTTPAATGAYKGATKGAPTAAKSADKPAAKTGQTKTLAGKLSKKKTTTKASTKTTKAKRPSKFPRPTDEHTTNDDNSVYDIPPAD